MPTRFVTFVVTLVGGGVRGSPNCLLALMTIVMTAVAMAPASAPMTKRFMMGTFREGASPMTDREEYWT